MQKRLNKNGNNLKSITYGIYPHQRELIQAVEIHPTATIFLPKGIGKAGSLYPRRK
jgi:hypothetical protein